VVGLSRPLVNSYDDFAPYYDALTGDGSHSLEFVQRAIDTWRPESQSLLELGCGTGSVLAGLSALTSLTGIDSSTAMLEFAAHKVPSAAFVQRDISTFQLDQQFDIIVCVFDTLNHLTVFTQWRSLIDAVADHLVVDGLFIFDVNTIGRLRQVVEEGDVTYDVGEFHVATSVASSAESLVTWQMTITDRRAPGDEVVRLEPICELAVPLDLLRTALSADFVVLSEDDGAGGRANDESERAHFVCRRRHENLS
jgi:predicted TPR repeat methyltransferase